MTRFLSASCACLLLLALTVTGCSTVENVLSGDKVDYRSTSIRSSGLEVPPDLTQLAKDSRYQQPSGTVSASSFQATAPVAAANAAPAPAPSTVAPQALGAVRIERLGSERWISSTLPPEQLFPLVRTFWKDSGFALVQDRADAGVLETDWVENRAKLPNDIIRNTIGKVFDSAFSTGELDKYRTRVERTPTGSDIYITHRGMVEVYTGQRTDSTVWQPRPTDPQLEGEFLALRPHHDLAFQVDGELVAGKRRDFVEERAHLRFAENDRQEAVLEAIVEEDVGKTGCDHAAKSVLVQRPGRVLTRGAAAEILARQQDGGALVTRLVEHEVRIGLALLRVLARLAWVQVAPRVEEVLPEARLADRLEELLGDDRVRVDVLAIHWGHEPFVEGEFLHVISSSPRSRWQSQPSGCPRLRPAWCCIRPVPVRRTGRARWR